MGTSLEVKYEPKHSEANKYLASGLFHGLKNISQLEERISKIPENLERGNAFEVFTEALINIQKVHQAKEVWPQSTCPTSIRQKLALPYKDKGIDGVIETVDGKYVAYQVKFRTGRTNLTWEDLSTFVGLGTRCDQLLLIANSYKAPAEYDNQPNAHSMRGTDLDHLTSKDFDAIEAWLKTGQVHIKRKKPDPHQKTAIGDISNGLKEHDRITALMACGTGKTLVTLWAAEKSGAKHILVLLPSLALVRQTLLEWVGEASWTDFTFLCVCSDPTVSKGADTPTIKSSELPFSVSSDPNEVRQFLEQDNARVKLVFSTYQSASVVAEGMKGSPPFELAIFDEAHKTAQKKGGSFSFALSDDNLPIKKRIFCTATPRRHNVMQRNKAGDAALVYSMDNEEVYGPIVHNLSFAKAAEMGVICNYKVLISAVTTDMVSEYLLSHGEVLIEGDEIRARQVANQLAMSEAVKLHGIRKIFSFHKSIKSARSYTSTEGNEGINTHIPELDCFHVHGKQATVQRDNILNEFKKCERGIVSNAKCLTEGVDVPTVDMVAFMSPKKSTVDIIQATGRAMRKPRSHSHKKVGYIFLPLYIDLHTGETLDDAVQRTDFDEIWNVLAAIQDQDEILAHSIQTMREEVGRKKGYDDSRFREKVEILGPSISLETLTKNITIFCVDRLGSSWDEAFGKLRRYKEDNGNCVVPRRYTKDKHLGDWVNTQRTIRGRGLLSKQKIERLNAVGFVWDPFEARWEAKFVEFLAFIEKYGNTEPSQTDPENKLVAQWANAQRWSQSRGKLTLDRMQRLESVGFRFNTGRNNEKWDEMYALLQEYKGTHGDTLVTQKLCGNKGLDSWTKTQRVEYNKDILAVEKFMKLEELGFEWDFNSAYWEKMFTILTAYKDKYGDCKVPAAYKIDIIFGRWVNTQRYQKNKGILPHGKEKRLSDLGFTWDLNVAKWDEMFSQLQEHKDKYGDIVKSSNFNDNKSLFNWIKTQQRNRKNSKISDEQISRLDALGFKWSHAK